MARKDKDTDLLETRKKAEAVEGQVLWPDLMKPISMAAGGFILATLLLGGAIYIATVSAGELIMARMIAYGILCLIYGLISVGILIFLLVRMRRLIIGEDRVQLLGGPGWILGQLPYNNILDIQLRGDDVTILLDKARRKDTWWSRMTDSSEDFDVKMTAGFETDAVALRLHLKDAVLAYRQKNGGPRWMN